MRSTHSLHGKVPVILDSFGKIDQSERDHPVLDLRRVGIEWKYLQLDRVESIDRNGGLRVGV